MRRFAPALGGRLSRRNIARSPHLWAATGAVFAIFAVACGALTFITDDFGAARLRMLGGALGAVSLVMLATRPPEPGTPASHAVLASVYLGTAASVAAFAPYGSATIVVGLFTGPLLAIWLPDRRTMATHLSVATVAVGATAGLTGDLGTIFAALCFLPSMWTLALCCMFVLEAVEAQGDEYERLALRDPLTGAGNRAYLDDQLPDELTRHGSGGSTLCVVDLRLDAFARINAEVGRATGDGVLATVAAVLEESGPPRTSVARTAGDRFTIVLPDTDTAAATDYLERARRRLALVDTGTTPLATRAGIGCFPQDATDAEELLTVAAARSAASEPERRERPPIGATARGLAVHLHDDLPVMQRSPAGTPGPEADVDRWSDALVTRHGFAVKPAVWRVTGGFFVLYALLGVGAMRVEASVQTPAAWATAALGFVLGAWILLLRPAAIGTRRNHAVVAATYVMPTMVMVALAPQASWSVGMAAFAGALIGSRLVERREVLAHLGAATALLGAVAISGRVDTPSILAVLTLLLSTWVLAGTYVSVLESAEDQGRRMADLVLRDPVTGAGNQRLLVERLADEVPRHLDMQMPLVMVDLDLCGLDELDREHGRGAVTDLLRDVAILLASTAGSLATVARIHHGHFRLLLPVTGPDDLDAFARDVRRAIAGTARRGAAVLPRIGSASFPEDGTTDEALVAIAERRMLEDDPRAHDLSATPPLDAPLPIRREVRWPRHADDSGAERRRSVG